MDQDLKSKLGEISTKLDAILELKRDIEAHVAHDQLMFYGEGEENPGLIRQVDRLNQMQKWRDRVNGVMLTAIIGIGADRLWALIQRWH